jgi:hypothetical protein
MSDITADWPAISDDTGALTDGTIINLALFNSIKTAINNQVKSTTNPTLTPVDAIDEVVLARGSKATLTARLNVSLNADGTLVAGSTTSYLDGTSDLGTNWRVNYDREFRLIGASVAHGITTVTETGAYGTLSTVLAANGGLNIRGSRIRMPSPSTWWEFWAPMLLPSRGLPSPPSRRTERAFRHFPPLS